MSIYSTLVKAYAKLCNAFLWPVSRKIAKRSPSLEMDHRRGAFSMSYEEYVSMAIFTSFFIMFEAFALFSAVALLFEYSPVIPEVPKVPVLPEIPKEVQPRLMDFKIIAEQEPFLLAGNEVVFFAESGTSETSCMLEINRVSYEFEKYFPEKECFNYSVSGGNVTHCFVQILEEGLFNQSFSFTPSEGSYSYGIECLNPVFSEEGSFEVYSDLYEVRGSSGKYPIEIIVLREDNEIASTEESQDFTLLVPEGNFVMTAFYEGADSSVNVSVPTGLPVIFSFSFGNVTISSPVNGTLMLSRGSFSEELSFEGNFSGELGEGEWIYEISSEGYAVNSGKFVVNSEENTSVEVQMLKRTILEIKTEPERLLTNENFFIHLNYTDMFGNPLYGYNAEVLVEGEPAERLNEGHYAYYFNATDEGSATLVVRVSKTFYEDQMLSQHFNIYFNEERQAALKMGLRIALTLFSTLVTVFAFMIYPSQKAISREVAIDSTLPFVLSHMSSMANSGISMPEIIKLMADYCSYEELKKEFSKMIKGMEILGYDLIKSLVTTAEHSPSKRFSDILSSLATTIHSGGNTALFLKEKADETRLDLTTKAREKTTSMMLLGEIYIILFVAAPIFLSVMLIAMEFVAGSAFPILPITMLKLVSYILIPVMTIVFLVYLMKELNTGI